MIHKTNRTRGTHTKHKREKGHQAHHTRALRKARIIQAKTTSRKHTEQAHKAYQVSSKRTTNNSHNQTAHTIGQTRQAHKPFLTLLEPHSHMWGQNALICSLSPKRDWGPKRVKPRYLANAVLDLKILFYQPVLRET